ncbi:MAG TPA: hypothetical protein VFQ37_02375 [Mycobacterium sp.]|nr:hypothetical protein [Mycobacterium sp.]
MTDPIAEASDTDLANQALPVDDPAGEPDPFTDDAIAGAEADLADVFEQHQSVPSSDDDYERE